MNRLTRARRLAAAWLRDWRQFRGGRLPRTCPIRGYHGMFVSVGHPGRWDARCLNRGSRERHRLLHLWITEGGGGKLAGKRILHFAPEKAFMRRMRGDTLYETADLPQAGVTHRVDLTRTGLPDAGYDVVIANHVLEHIPDDRAAMRELFRLLKPGGYALLTVPINASRPDTYEDPSVTAAPELWAHFSAHDHLRYYGLDFSDRLVEAGFQVETFRVSPRRRSVAVCCETSGSPSPANCRIPHRNRHPSGHHAHQIRQRDIARWIAEGEAVGADIALLRPV
jgi:SAM-dependent methyltransferase